MHTHVASWGTYIRLKGDGGNGRRWKQASKPPGTFSLISVAVLGKVVLLAEVESQSTYFHITIGIYPYPSSTY